MTAPAASIKPGLFAYKTAPEYDGAAALDGFDPDPSAKEMSLELWTGRWDTGWSHMAPYTDAQGNACVLSCNATQGRLQLSAIAQDGQGTRALSADRSDDYTGCNFVTCVSPSEGGQQSFLIGTTADASARVLTLAPDGHDISALSAAVDFPCTKATQVIRSHGVDEDLLLCLSPGGVTQALNLQGLQDGGHTTLWTDTRDIDWSHGVVVRPGQHQIFAYCSASGAWQLCTVGTLGPIWLEGGTWREGLDTFVPFQMSGFDHVLGYQSESGDVEILRFHEGAGNAAEVVWKFRWSAGWDIQVPLRWGIR
jgi:hypothetical protein